MLFVATGAWERATQAESQQGRPFSSLFGGREGRIMKLTHPHVYESVWELWG